MSEYIEVFRMEAKSLLKNFRNNDETAVKRVKKVFGDRDDLSLMNMQHVVAQEYGFLNWNALATAGESKLVDALVGAKNNLIKTPFRAYNGGKTVGEAEQTPIMPVKERRGVDLVQFKDFSGGFESEWLPLKNMDLSGYDLRKLDVKFASFDDRTVWSDDKTKLPLGFAPHEFFEQHKNPGLGVRELHKQGIDGRGRAVAIIDFQVLRDHLEYHRNLKGYEEIGVAADLATSAGGRLVSALVGKTCGVAPRADVYYYSVGQQGRSQKNFAKALQKVCDLHEELKREGKNGIDTVCILPMLLEPMFANDEGATEMRAAASRAERLGIWVNCGAQRFDNKGRYDRKVHCVMNGDVDNFADYVLMPSEKPYPEEYKDMARKDLCFPAGGRTVATAGRLIAYEFSAPGFYLKPYQCGLFVLARSIKEDLSVKEFMQCAWETGDFKENVGVIVNPKRLIETLKG